MKNDNYNELIDRYYAGQASAEEIVMLRNEGLVNEETELYTSALNTERTKKLDWDFEDFMSTVEHDKVAKPVTKIYWMKRVLAAAAVILAIVSGYLFMESQKTNPKVPSVAYTKPASTVKEVKPVDIPLVNNNSKPAEIKSTPAVKILKAKTPVLKKLKQEPIENTTDAQPDFEKYLVIINGKAVTNEEDALAITRESMAMVSRNLTSSIEEMRPVTQIKEKLRLGN